jgi:hypothetical protein
VFEGFLDNTPKPEEKIGKGRRIALTNCITFAGFEKKLA